LVPQDRGNALALYVGLQLGVQAAVTGADSALTAARAHLETAGIQIDYVALVDPTTFEPFEGEGEAILLVAAFVGTTRLIDNVRLAVGDAPASKGG
jgi:pantoate--beta-alanine ligase